MNYQISNTVMFMSEQPRFFVFNFLFIFLFLITTYYSVHSWYSQRIRLIININCIHYKHFRPIIRTYLTHIVVQTSFHTLAQTCTWGRSLDGNAVVITSWQFYNQRLVASKLVKTTFDFMLAYQSGLSNLYCRSTAQFITIRNYITS